MKTLNKQKNLSIFKRTMALGFIALALASCGKDTQNEVVNTDGTNNGSNPVVTTPAIPNSTVANFWQNLKTQNVCPSGSSRMADMNFTLQGGAYGAQIQGFLQAGVTSGQVTQTYTGMNPGTKDAIFISQVINGNQVNYNVVVSLCRWQNQYAEYIGDNSGLTNFRVNYMTLSNSTNCATGEVLDGWLTFYSQTYGGDIPTRFSPVSASCY